MTGHGAKFGRKKEEAVAALLSQRNVEEAARIVGIDAKTLLRWLKLPEFKTAYLQARREAVGQATARLQQSTGAAASTYLKLMVDPNVPAAVRLRAAECVFAQAVKAIEQEDLEARLVALEAAAPK
jgi:transposase-like protein